jgi:hypothetical protein
VPWVPWVPAVPVEPVPPCPCVDDPLGPEPGLEPRSDGCAPDDCWPALPLGDPLLEGLPLDVPEPLLPLLFRCCCGNGDSLPPLDWLEPWLVLGLPPEVDGDAVGDDEPDG